MRRILPWTHEGAPFLVLVLTVALTLLAIGVGGWWLVVAAEPAQPATSQPADA